MVIQGNTFPTMPTNMRTYAVAHQAPPGIYTQSGSQLVVFCFVNSFRDLKMHIGLKSTIYRHGRGMGNLGSLVTLKYVVVFGGLALTRLFFVSQSLLDLPNAHSFDTVSFVIWGSV